MLLGAAYGCGTSPVPSTVSPVAPAHAQPPEAGSSAGGAAPTVAVDSDPAEVDEDERSDDEPDAHELALRELVAPLDAAGVRTLRVDGDLVLIGDATQTLLCGARGPCVAVPFAAHVTELHASDRRRAVLVVHPSGDVSETWEVQLGTRRARRVARRVSSGAQPGAHAMPDRAPRPSLRLTTAPRPAVVSMVPREDDAADEDEEEPAQVCVPRVSTTSVTQDGRGAEIRVASCEDVTLSMEDQPVSLRIAWGAPDALPWTAAVGAMPYGGVHFDVVEIVRVLDEALVFVARRSDGGSPSGESDLGLFVATRVGERLRLDRWPVASTGTEGLGVGDAGDEYVVAVERRQLSYEVVVPEGARAPTALRFTGCETWRGVHLRSSDRDEGTACSEPLGVTVRFDARRGSFEVDEATEEALAACCASEGASEDDR